MLLGLAANILFGGLPVLASLLDEFRDQWNTWHPNVPLITLRSQHRALAPPVVEYLQRLERDDRYHRPVVLIPEMQAAHPWQRILHNQRGFVLDRAIQRGTANVVICRPRFRPDALRANGQPPEEQRPAAIR